MVIAAFGLLPIVAVATQAPVMLLYRYVDSRGVTVLDRQGVPPEYVGKGYQVLNQSGRVVQTVPPAPTAEEIRLKQQAQVQSQADAQLLDRYPSLEELDKASARRRAEIDALIAVATANVQTLQGQQTTLQGQAAAQERAGQEVSTSMLDQLRDVQAQIIDAQARIAKLQQTRSEADAGFAQQRTQLVKLLESPL
ncbi:DUF4124 domain-containing protein [Pseudomonas coleopterorum]|uniref:DUF4124 domain-containing protein n=1 Tax=Pseudomonas coleopterorum TaxID=1605838 RepID=A0ABR9BXL9_9PSED|nr:DUF4124 domain-containing protein [Pseudomonas coleopterorum]MBD8769183.1 DUF4124 domain-containing protein [Pseudomonas coleopterorum]